MSIHAYVRWQKDEPREGRVFPPLAESHPAYGLGCLLCTEPLGDGTPVQLFALGPEDVEDREKHAAGGWYTALGLLLHARCVTGVEPLDFGPVAS